MGLYSKDAHYLKLSLEELNALSDEQFFYAVLVRTERKVDGFADWGEGVNSLNPHQKIFYCVNWLETEVNNGGLCQFFVNYSRMAAPLVSDYMAIIGAQEHKKLYDDFLLENGIDPKNLSSFDIEELEEFEGQYERYPFDEYDDAFDELEPLESYLTKYAREHLESF